MFSEDQGTARLFLKWPVYLYTNVCVHVYEGLGRLLSLRWFTLLLGNKF